MNEQPAVLLPHADPASADIGLLFSGEWRRSRRVERVNPHLIALLRTLDLSDAEEGRLHYLLRDRTVSTLMEGSLAARDLEETVQDAKDHSNGTQDRPLGPR